MLTKLTRAFKRLIPKTGKQLWEKPSESILNHLNGTGNGFDLDDLLSIRREEDMTDWQKEVFAQINRIDEEFRNSHYAIGSSNPASHETLRKLALSLQRQGR